MADLIEIWKSIPGFSGYEASNLGRLKALKRQSYNARSGKLCWRKERILSNNPDKTGYISVCIKGPTLKKTWLAHRLIAIAWLPNSENKPFINHKNGIKTDNRVENLEWCTRSENGIHAVKAGLHTPLRGESNGNRKLSKEIVLQIRESEGRQIDISKKFGIGRTTVGYIKKRKLWAHL